jgi:hypothetical protein
VLGLEVHQFWPPSEDQVILDIDDHDYDDDMLKVGLEVHPF